MTSHAKFFMHTKNHAYIDKRGMQWVPDIFVDHPDYTSSSSQKSAMYVAVRMYSAFEKQMVSIEKRHHVGWTHLDPKNDCSFLQ